MPPNRPYETVLTPRARRELARLPPKVRNQIGRTLERLAAAYSAGQRPQDIRPIEGEPGSYGIDSGEYRVLYEVEDASTEDSTARLRIWRIVHRKDVYRNL